MINADQPCVATKWDQFRWKYLSPDSPERLLYRLLSEKWCGNEMVPLDHRTLRVPNDGCEYVFGFLNDSFEIGIGWPDRWHGIYRREVIHRFIWWYLRQWVFGEWFGLRRWIWYKLLNRRVNTSRQHAVLGCKECK